MNFLIFTSWLVALSCFADVALANDAALETVSRHGRLSVNGADLVDQYGQKVQLKGFALFWDVWMPQFYNEDTVIGIHNRCRGNVVRASMAVETEYDGGFLIDPLNTLDRVKRVVDAAIKEDIYVIVDWHEEHAENHLAQAREFFDLISKQYYNYSNIIYETFNEPVGTSWTNVLKPYHEAIINTIRANDPNNVIVVGTPNWSQQVDQAAADPIRDQRNIMYTLHFYAGTHKQWLRDTATAAIARGLPIFVTEYGTVNADGDGQPDVAESRLWWDWLDANNISYVNWAISDKLEGASALVEHTTAAQVCEDQYLTTSGRLVVEQNRK